MKIALTIAGSDSSGGAGVQADLIAFHACGVYGICALTAVTAQSPSRVERVLPIRGRMVSAQIEAASRELRPSAVKTGMLWSEEIVRAVARAVRRRRLQPLVVDPLIASQSGRRLLGPKGVRAMVSLLFPLAELITPNIGEAEFLTGEKISKAEDIPGVVRRLREMGPRNVLVTGWLSGSRAVDWYYDGKSLIALAGMWRRGITLHGSGCILSAAITAGLARGLPVGRAVRFGRRYVSRQIERSWSPRRTSGIALRA